MSEPMGEGMEHVVNRLETARSVLNECCYFTESEALEEEISRIEERVSELVEEPEKAAAVTPPKKPISVPPTTDEKVYKSWLESLEKSEQEGSRTPTERSSISSDFQREKRSRVPPTTDEKVYKSWLESLEG